MNIQGEPITSILGVDVQAKHKKEMKGLNRSTSNPVIHKQIRGGEVYIPLNWPRS